MVSGGNVDGEIVHAGNPNFAFAEHCTRDCVFAESSLGREVQGAGVVANRGVSGFDDANSAFFCFDAGVDVVNALSQGLGEQAFEGGDDYGLALVVGQFALQLNVEVIDSASG